MNLTLSASGEVGQEPGALDAHRLFGMVEQPNEMRHDAEIDDALSLQVLAGGNVAENAQQRRGESILVEKVDKAAQIERVEDGLDAIVRAIANVRDRPAQVDERLGVALRAQQLGHHRK